MRFKNDVTKKLPKFFNHGTRQTKQNNSDSSQNY